MDNARAEPADTDLARSALADARYAAGGRPGRRDRGTGTRREIRRDNLTGRNRTGRGGSVPGRTERNIGGYSRPGPDPSTDPQPVGALLPGLVDDQGWERPLAEARVFAEWSALVGADIAAHATPQTLRAGELRIAAQSSAWATQLRLLSATLLARLVAELGPQVVTKLVISGPTAPSWKHGARTVHGARGPRDTYG